MVVVVMIFGKEKFEALRGGGEWNWNGVGDGVRSRCRVDDVWGGLARWPPPALSGRLGFGLLVALVV